MKKIAYVFLSLLSVFFIVWGVKARILPKRPANLDDGKDAVWSSNYTAPKAAAEWVMDASIDDNYIPVPGKEDYFYVVDKDGNVIQTKKRIKQIDGSYVFEDVQDDNAMKVVDKKKNIYQKDGEYVKYIRNKDNTYAFVPVDKKGNYLNFDKNADTIDKKHVLENSAENIYGLYNDDGVRIGTTKRVKNKKGNYEWKLIDDPKTTQKVGNGGAEHQNQFVADNQEKKDNQEKIKNDEGYTRTETKTYSETKDGFRIMYKITTTKTYDANGNLKKSKTSEPEIVSKTKITGIAASPDPSKIADSLDKEVSRISDQVSFNTAKANQILTKLNAQRKRNGVPTFKMDTSSDIYKIAKIRAADMAIYDHASIRSPLYGNTQDICSRFGIALVNVTQNMWKTSESSASDIHTKFQATDSTRETRMSEGYGQIGIAVVDKDGETFVIEVFAQ